VKNATKKRKNTRKYFQQISGDDLMKDHMHQIISKGKKALDELMMDMGKMLAESILQMDREEQAGSDYAPIDPKLQKWASQGGSVYLGDQKVKLQVPRLRHTENGEVPLKSYLKMKERGQFSEELLQQAMRGLSQRKYNDTVTDSAKAFGVSPSTISRHIVEVTSKRLKEFAERDLSGHQPFAIFIDTVHRGDEAFIVALGIDLMGNKLALGFWQGATENSEICNELLADLERRGMKLFKRIIWITDGGLGVIKSLKECVGKKLIHQRCTIHKDRNIQRHLAKQYRKEAHRRYRTALEQESYKDAKQMLMDFEKWLRKKNDSAANSLLEAIEEILTVHRLQVPALLRKTLHSTNPIESMFSTVRHCEGNIKRYRGSKMMCRWLASVLIHAESNFRRIKGHGSINEVVERIEKEQGGKNPQIEINKAA